MSATFLKNHTIIKKTNIMQFVKYKIYSLLLLGGLFALWPGQGLHAQGEGVQLLSIDEGTPDLIMLQVNRDNFGNFARFNTDLSNNNDRLLISTANANEQIRIGLASRAEADGSNDNLSYYFLIRDMSDGSVVHGPFRVLENNDNIENWTQARYAPGAGGYDDTIQSELFQPNGEGIPTRRSGSPQAPMYRFAPGKAGTFSLEFLSASTAADQKDVFIPFWNFTVIDPTDGADLIKEGRLWSRNWSFRTPQITPVNTNSADCIWNRPFRGDFYSFTTDSLVTRVDFADTGMRGLSFNIAFNSTGPNPAAPSLLEQRRSVDGENLTSNSAEHQIFLSIPDPVLFPRVQEACASISVVATELDCAGTPDCLPVEITAPGQIEVLWVFTDPQGVEREIPIGVEDVTRAEFDANGGQVCIPIDGFSEIPGDITEIRLRVVFSRGAQHWGAYDVEFMNQGFEVTTLGVDCTIPGFESGDNILYWDDSDIPLDPNVSTIMPVTTGTRFNFSTETYDRTDRAWNNFTLNQSCNGSGVGDDNLTTGYGDKSTLNTWWYAYRQEVAGPTITIPPLIIDVVNQDCDAGGTTLTANFTDNPTDPDLSYAWTGPNGFTATTRVIVPAVIGEYCVTGTLPDNCGRTTCFELETIEGAAPMITVAPVAPICGNENVTLSVSSPEDPNVTYTWTPVEAFVPGTNTSATPIYLASSGITTVSVNADNGTGCDTDREVNLTFVDDITLTVEVNDDPCEDTATLTATVGGAANFRVRWENAAGDSLAAGLTYIPTMLPPNTMSDFTAVAINTDCEADAERATVQVQYQPAEISVPSSIVTVCPSEEVVLSVINEDPADTLRYIWTPAEFFVDNTLAMPDYLEANGSQTVQVKATNQFGCMDSLPVEIIIQEPLLFEVEVVFDDVCTPVDTLRATILQGSATVEWLDADDNVVGAGLTYVTNTGEGTSVFRARFTSTNPDCEEIVVSEELSVRYEPVNISVPMPTVDVCPGEEVILSVINEDANDTLIYMWTPAEFFVDNTLAMPD
ncbi:MAG: hypothetical protein D6772_03640, partial [Bacteroidetes bacterium]